MRSSVVPGTCFGPVCCVVAVLSVVGLSGLLFSCWHLLCSPGVHGYAATFGDATG